MTVNFDFIEHRINGVVKPWLSVREWDGIDRPVYYKIFEVTPAETKSSGRFLRCTSIIGSPFQYKFELNASINLENLINWVSENVQHNWALDVESNFGEYLWLFSFENEEDAVLFRLTIA
jgi:hypothetical protein